MKFLLDTHAWIWWSMEPDKLSKLALQTIRDSKRRSELLLSTISFWEFCKLVELGRIKISCDALTWIKSALEIPTLQCIDISPEIAYHSTTLPGDFHKDPVDQLLVSTARIHEATIITSDKSIKKYRHVKSLW